MTICSFLTLESQLHYQKIHLLARTCNQFDFNDVFVGAITIIADRLFSLFRYPIQFYEIYYNETKSLIMSTNLDQTNQIDY